MNRIMTPSEFVSDVLSVIDACALSVPESERSYFYRAVARYCEAVHGGFPMPQQTPASAVPHPPQTD